MRHVSLILALILVAAYAAIRPARADLMEGLLGRWRDSDGDAEILIARCGVALCGKIVWLRQESADTQNPDPTLRGRPLLGLQVLGGIRPGTGDTSSGEGYNPSDGRTYLTTLTLPARDRLVIRGCMLGGLICDDDTWTRRP